MSIFALDVLLVLIRYVQSWWQNDQPLPKQAHRLASCREPLSQRLRRPNVFDEEQIESLVAQIDCAQILYLHRPPFSPPNHALALLICPFYAATVVKLRSSPLTSCLRPPIPCRDINHTVCSSVVCPVHFLVGALFTEWMRKTINLLQSKARPSLAIQ